MAKKKNKKRLKQRILTDGAVVIFTPITVKCGRAEFVCCPVFNRGKLRELYLYPKQQPNAKEYFVYKFDYAPENFRINSWTHKGISRPEIWIHGWCQEHKCASFRFYVPVNSNCFKVRALSIFSIDFDKEGSPNVVAPAWSRVKW